MAVYLKSLPPGPVRPRRGRAAAPAQMQRGAKIYGEHCAACHGDAGRGVLDAYVPLAGNRAVMLASPANLVQVVLGGAFAPPPRATPAPSACRPLPPCLSDEDIAAVLSYIRNAWGNRASAVQPQDMQPLRSSARP